MDLEEVVDRAVQFLERKAGYPIHKLLKVEHSEEEGRWYLEFDVGILNEKIIKIVIDDEKGKILRYEGPAE